MLSYDKHIGLIMVDKSNRRFGIAFILLTILIFGLTALSLAQNEDEPVWQPPINLSKSGVATEPQVVVDFSGRIHALWREDEIHGYVYTHEDSEGGWTRPLPLELPFATRRWFDEDELREEEPTPLFDPYLAADATGRIHALWKNDDAELFYSQVGANKFEDFSSWTTPLKVAIAATAVTAQVDDAGRIHLAYINPLDTVNAPSGIYYQSAASNEPVWSDATLLSDSTYFRAMPGTEANLQMQVTTENGVWVGWENPIIEQIFLIGSPDGGQNWGDVLIVDRRDEKDKAYAQGPTKLRLTSAANALHAFWQAGHGNELCSQYHMYSVDGGINWTFPEELQANEGCPLESHAVGFANDPSVVFLAMYENETSMMAWDGSMWSLPQSQSLHLGALGDANTFQTITLDCQKSFLINDQRLIITGCDSVEENEPEPVRDNWLLERSLEDMETWFAQPSIWAEPVDIAELVSDNVNFTMVTTEQSHFHAFWGAENAVDVHFGNVFTDQTSIISKLLDDVSQLNIAADAQGQYVMVWPDSTGLLLFSKVDVTRVSAISEWSLPLELPIPRAGVAQAAVGIAPDGQIVVVYVVPVNEERGVYITKSSDGGESWSDFELVFDAELANWSAVGSPRLTFTYPNHMHLTWTHTDAQGEEIRSLYYGRSVDGGKTWTEPEEVDSNGTQTGARIVWNELIGFGEQIVHRLWQTVGNGRVTVWHQVSTDDGASWSTPITVTSDLGVVDLDAPVTLTADDSGRLFLFAAASDRVRYHVWQGESWLEGEAFVLPEKETIGSLGAAITVDNKLGMIMTLKPEEDKNGNAVIAFTTAQTEPPVVELPPLPTLTPTPLPTPTLIPTPGPQPTPTIAFPVDPGENWTQSFGLPVGNNAVFQMVSGILPGVLLAFLVVLLVFFVGLRVVRRR